MRTSTAASGAGLPGDLADVHADVVAGGVESVVEEVFCLPDEKGGLLGAYPRSPVPLPNHRSIRDSRNGKTTCIISADATYGAREIGPYN
ncbi:MAG TPA: hypothetical protein PLG75_12025 [Methanoculleus sp.]|nr:hypothetical protein [Methanoculleus sp.]